MDARKCSREILEDVIALRRRLHMCPETGMECRETTDVICAELDRYGIEYRRLGDSGVIADIHGRKDGKTVMLRADMDALKIKEETGLEYASRNEGLMHACGHDMHTAMLLGSARILNEHKDELNGNVRLLFQAGEEVSEGARFLIENGALEGVDMGFGMHVDPLSEAHRLSSRRGASWAAVDHFTVKVKGKGGHGAMPHKTSDAIVAASSIVMNLQTIVSRMCSPVHPVVVTVGQIHSGSAYNIISEEAFLEGTCRCFDEEEYGMLPEAFSRICSNIASALGCTAEVEFSRICRPLVNDERAYDIMKKSAEKIMLNEDGYFEAEQAMAGEDFAEYASRIPCVFMNLGTDGGYPLHSSHLDLKEEAMETGMAMEVQFAADALAELE